MFHSLLLTFEGSTHMESIYFCTSAKLFCIRNNQQAFFSRNSPDISHSLYLPILIFHSLYPLLVMFPTTFIFHSLCLPIPVSQSLFFTPCVFHYLYFPLPISLSPFFVFFTSCLLPLVSSASCIFYFLYSLLPVFLIPYVSYSLYLPLLVSPYPATAPDRYYVSAPTGTTCPWHQIIRWRNSGRATYWATTLAASQTHFIAYSCNVEISLRFVTHALTPVIWKSINTLPPADLIAPTDERLLIAPSIDI